ncbi:MAG: hypothetical protein Q7K57_29310 [Burkholderiaceae bacterium]|nr:hypothetical protein [Burkholderiaceae bacterium]
MKRAEVFTPNTLPSVTYVGEHLIEKKKLLDQNLEMGGAVIAISGPSKSGKTVFIETAGGYDTLILVSGANVTHPDDLWRRVFTAIGTPIPATNMSNMTISGAATGGIEGGVPMVAKATGSLTLKADAASGQSSDVRPDFLALLIRELKDTSFVVFVDDFHYIAKSVQVEVASLIKEAVRQGLRFVVASVSYHSDDVLIANNDLRGRLLKLDFDYWDTEELSKIAEKGFAALNVEVSKATIQSFAMESAGSPQLMQSLCLNLCFEEDIYETGNESRVIQPNVQTIDKICRRAAQTNDYSSVIRVMKDGPKVRGTERNSYVLKDGKASDVYPILMKAISLSPPELTLSYPSLLTRIASVCVNDHPQGSSVTGACMHMSALANDVAGAPIVEWDAEKDVLDIRDPYLLFALRWSELT